MVAISTSGFAKKIFQADEANVSVFLNIEADDHAQASKDAAKLHNDFAATLQKLAEAKTVENLAIDPLQIRQAERWHDQKTEKYFVASSNFSFSITDFVEMEKLLGEVSKTDGLTNSGLIWGLSDEKTAQFLPEIQRNALKDAITKAENYATELGAKGIKVLAVYEPGTSSPAPRPMMGQPMMKSVNFDSVAQASPIVEASKVTLSAQINIDAETIN